MQCVVTLRDSDLIVILFIPAMNPVVTLNFQHFQEEKNSLKPFCWCLYLIDREVFLISSRLVCFILFFLPFVHLVLTGVFVQSIPSSARLLLNNHKEGLHLCSFLCVRKCLRLKVRISLITLYSLTYQETPTLPVHSLGFGPSCRTKHRDDLRLIQVSRSWKKWL